MANDEDNASLLGRGGKPYMLVFLGLMVRRVDGNGVLLQTNLNDEYDDGVLGIVMGGISSFNHTTLGRRPDPAG
jgi:hypothetical protein